MFLVHPGGPFWKNKDDGAWSIPKGEYGAGEDPLAVARREYTEELGSAPPATGYRPLGDVRQAGGKTVSAWAVEGDFDPAHSNPIHSKSNGRRRAASGSRFPRSIAERGSRSPRHSVKILAGQRPFLERLQEQLGGEN